MDIKEYRYILGCQRALAAIQRRSADADVRRSVSLAYSYLLPAVTRATSWFASADGKAAQEAYMDWRVRRFMKRREPLRILHRMKKELTRLRVTKEKKR
jgi:hypothetical protein